MSFNFFQLFGQELSPVFENITDGLPSTEVHDIFQDSIGYMWFASDRGICRYDGENFKIVETSQQLKSNVIFKFFKQSETCIWLVTGDDRLYTFNPFDVKPQFIAFKENEKLLSLNNYSVFSLSVSEMQFKSDTIYIFSRKLPGYIFITQNKVEYINESNWLKGSPFDIEIKTVNHHYYTILKQKSASKHNYINFRNYKIPFTIQNKYNSCGVTCFLEEDNNQYLAIGDKLICHKSGKSSHIQLPSHILSMVLVDEKYFIGTFNGVFVLNENLEILNHFLKGEVITKLFINNSQVLWIGTVQNGVYFCIDLQIDEILFSNQRSITKILKINSNLALSNKIDGDVAFLNSKLKTSKVFADVYVTNFFLKSINTDISEFTEAKRQYTSPNKDNYRAKYLLSKYDNSNYIFTDNILYKFSNQKLTPYYLFDEKLQSKFSCQIDSSNVIIGSKKGLLHFNLNTKKQSEFHSEITKNNEFNAYITFEGLFLFASKKGIFYLDGEEFKLLPNSYGLDLKNFSTADHGFVFTYSDKDIFRIDKENGNLKFEKVEFRIAKAELFILSVEVFNNQLWIATKKGLFIKELKAEKKHKPSSFYVFHADSIFVGNEKVNVNSDIEIMPENGIKMYFSIITFYKNNTRKLEYSIGSDIWFEMNKNSLSIANLSPGEYTLKIRSIDAQKPILFSKKVLVLKHFYQKEIFFIFCIILLALGSYFLVRKVFQIKESKNKKELERLNLELKLLTSKMNPHFTFNTINSIQHSIMKSDKKSAIQYLSEFALLMRKSLDFSMTERILLQDEKEFIELYVKMENKRFNSNFILQFNIESELIVSSKKIPSMLIQPLVENIILHADYKAHETKIIQVDISYITDYFLIKVIDYGVGKTEQNTQLSNHKSYGLEILRSRVKMYNGKDYRENNVNIGFTFPQEKKGTTVTIKLKEWKR